MASLCETLEWLADAPRHGLAAQATLADLARLVIALSAMQPQPMEAIRCGRGCSACCHQPAPLSPAEAFHVAELVRAAPVLRRRMSMVRRQELRAGITWRDPDRMTRWQSARIPCPALADDGACMIHPDRPLVCREHLVDSDPLHCGDPTGHGIRLIEPSWRLRDVLLTACAELLEDAPTKVPLPQVLAWAHRHRAWGRRRWPREQLIRAVGRWLGTG